MSELRANYNMCPIFSVKSIIRPIGNRIECRYNSMLKSFLYSNVWSSIYKSIVVTDRLAATRLALVIHFQSELFKEKLKSYMAGML